MNITLYGPEQQAVGAFDGGKITEQKPIGFPGEGSAVKRVGPLFYWAWAHAPEAGYIPPHPHHAFEIMTYVIQGRAEHGDSLGTRSVVEAGGAQVMQTNSGVYHEERFVGPDMEGFQIWFEPYIREALQREPTYNQYAHEDFPEVEADGARVKTVLGDGSPIRLVTDALMWDIQVSPGGRYRHALAAGRVLAALAIRGNGRWLEEGEDRPIAFRHRDFMLIRQEREAPLVLTTDDPAGVRMILIEVPAEVDYPLYSV